MSSVDFQENWTTLSDTVDGMIESLDALQDSLFKFGITYLDDLFHGVCRNDVILIGAPSGGGKTQLSAILTRNFAMQGKRVWMFALEAMKHEIGMRICYSINGKEFSSYSDFLFNADKQKRADLIRKAMASLPGKDLIKVFYKSDQFGTSDLTKEFYAMEGKCDIAIVDYFQFVDLDGERSEIVEQKELANEINRLQKVLNVPVIILAQFNKAFAKSGAVFPTLADFYGTSALTNMCTKAITVTYNVPDACKVNQPIGTTPTLLYTPKFRYDGGRAKYFGIVPFDQSTGFYRSQYLLCDANEQAPVSGLKPDWAKHAIELRPY